MSRSNIITIPLILLTITMILQKRVAETKRIVRQMKKILLMTEMKIQNKFVRTTRTQFEKDCLGRCKDVYIELNFTDLSWIGTMKVEDDSKFELNTTGIVLPTPKTSKKRKNQTLFYF